VRVAGSNPVVRSSPFSRRAGGPTDQRARFQNPILGPTWGLHLADVTIALGNLVDLVRSQARSYVA
jgi:hypothetical protein